MTADALDVIGTTRRVWEAPGCLLRGEGTGSGPRAAQWGGQRCPTVSSPEPARKTQSKGTVRSTPFLEPSQHDGRLGGFEHRPRGGPGLVGAGGHLRSSSCGFPLELKAGDREAVSTQISSCSE